MNRYFPLAGVLTLLLVMAACLGLPPREKRVVSEVRSATAPWSEEGSKISDTEAEHIRAALEEEGFNWMAVAYFLGEIAIVLLVVKMTPSSVLASPFDD